MEQFTYSIPRQKTVLLWLHGPGSFCACCWLLPFWIDRCQVHTRFWTNLLAQHGLLSPGLRSFRCSFCSCVHHGLGWLVCPDFKRVWEAIFACFLIPGLVLLAIAVVGSVGWLASLCTTGLMRLQVARRSDSCRGKARIPEQGLVYGRYPHHCGYLDFLCNQTAEAVVERKMKIQGVNCLRFDRQAHAGMGCGCFLADRRFFKRCL
jgi:hypothetical protein